MKKVIQPSTLALLLVSALFVLATILSGCTNLHRMRGDRHYERFNYALAAKEYVKSLDRKKDQSVRLRLAEAYRQNNQTHLAEKHYRKIVNLSPGDRAEFAAVLMINGKYQAARKLIRTNLRARPDDQDFRLLLASCDSLPVFLHSEPAYTIERLPAPVNTGGSNFGTTFYGDGIVFASERPSSQKGREAGWTGQNFLDLFYTEQTHSDDWSDPVALQGRVNTAYHEGAATFHPEGNHVFFTRNNFFKGRKFKDAEDVNHLQLFYAKNEDGQWKSVRSFPFNSDAYSTGQPAMAQDGQTLYFISDMPGGFGGTDIYVTSFSDGEFSEPVNLGPEINTTGDEMFPFIHVDGSLYFASNGHPGLGGLDLYRASYEADEWSRPQNLRAPLNSSRDDFALAVYPDGEYGFFSSNRGTEDGTDEIYSFEKRKQPLRLDGIVLDKVTRDPIPGALVTLLNTLTGKEMAVHAGPLGEFQFPIEAGQHYRLDGTMDLYVPDSKGIDTEGIEVPIRTVLELEPVRIDLEGVVLNRQTGAPIPNARVELVNHADGTSRSVQSDPKGAFAFRLAPESVYTLRGAKKGYNDDYESVSTKNITRSEVIRKELFLDSLEIGKAIVLENIYYDFDKWNIRTDAATELDKLVRVLRENPEINIELSSHTDSRGSDAYNLRLSDNRARSAVAYIISRGIAARRLVARGYGETRHVNACANDVPCSEEDHQMNRRTEFKVTSYGNLRADALRVRPTKK